MINFIAKMFEPKKRDHTIVAAEQLHEARLDLLNAQKELEYWAGWVPTLQKRVQRLTTHTPEPAKEPAKSQPESVEKAIERNERMEVVKYAAYCNGRAYGSNEIGPTDFVDELKVSQRMRELVLDELQS